MLFYDRGAVMQPEESNAVKKGMQTLWFIWAAMLSTLLIYITLCHLLGEGFKASSGPELPISLLRKIFFGLAAVVLIASYYLRRSNLKSQPRASAATIVKTSFALNQPPFVGLYIARVIVSLAFSESIGIYGLVLFLLGDSFQTLYTFIGVSALAMVFYRPKKEELEKLARTYKQVRAENH